MSIIQQLEDLKEWAQNPERYERRLAFRSNNPMGTEAGTIPIEFDELSPQEQDYYQNPPFSTHSDFLGAKGGSAQLVQPGPGRLGFDRGGMANVLNYLENLEPGTNVTMNDITTIAKKNKWEFNSATLYRMLNHPDKMQKSKSGNEVFLYGEKNRNRAKNIIQRINFEQKIQIKPTEEVFKKIDLMIADKEKFPSMKSIGEELGYKPTKKGQGGNLNLDSVLMNAWKKSRGRNLILEMRFKEYKLTKDSPWVKKVIELRKELGSTRATAKKLKVDNKTIRNVLSQFDKTLMGKVNLRKSNKWNYHANRAKREAELAKRLGGKKNPAFLQYMDLWEDIVDMNEDILRMSDDAIWKNERIRQSMNLDATGLKVGDPINFDRYKNLSKKEFAKKVRDLAENNKNQFFQAEHSIPIASEKIAAAYPNNLQVAQGRIGGQLEAIKTYIRNNPNGEHIPQINEILDEFDIQIREGGKTYGWNNPKDKAGLNVYNTQSRTSDIVESAMNKSQTGKINNPRLKIFSKEIRRPGGKLYSFPGMLADKDLYKHLGKDTKKAWNIFRKVGGPWEAGIIGLDFINNLDNGMDADTAFQTALENFTMGIYKGGQRAQWEDFLQYGKELGHNQENLSEVKNIIDLQKMLKSEKESLKRLISKKGKFSEEEIGWLLKSSQQVVSRLEKELDEKRTAFWSKDNAEQIAQNYDDTVGYYARQKYNENFDKGLLDSGRKDRVNPEMGSIGSPLWESLSDWRTYLPQNLMENTIATRPVVRNLRKLPGIFGDMWDPTSEQAILSAMSEEEKAQRAKELNIQKQFYHPVTGNTMTDQQMEPYYEKFYAGGGIATLHPRRPGALPPPSGPDSQGLAYLNNYATKRTE